MPPPPGNEKGKDKDHFKMNENEENWIPPSANPDSDSTLTLTAKGFLIHPLSWRVPKIPPPEEPEGDEEENKFVPSVEFSHSFRFLPIYIWRIRMRKRTQFSRDVPISLVLTIARRRRMVLSFGLGTRRWNHTTRNAEISYFEVFFVRLVQPNDIVAWARSNQNPPGQRGRSKSPTRHVEGECQHDCMQRHGWPPSVLS